MTQYDKEFEFYVGPATHLEGASLAIDGTARIDGKIVGKVSVKHLVDHIDYMVSYMGIDHVGISSDFDGGGGVLNWKDASETFNVTHELVKRGYSKEQIKKLWGLNLLRVLDEVENISRELMANNLVDL